MWILQARGRIRHPLTQFWPWDTDTYSAHIRQIVVLHKGLVDTILARGVSKIDASCLQCKCENHRIHIYMVSRGDQIFALRRKNMTVVMKT